MTGALDNLWARGFTGKVPARGDFVGAGLPRDFTEPWHDWQSEVIAGSREIMGDGWLDAFLEAPVWRFILPPGQCGMKSVVGLIMPSVDKVGRYFPLTFAALPGALTPVAEDWAAWLDAAETLGRLALDEDALPETLMPPECPPPNAAAHVSVAASWWTDGAPRVAAAKHALSSLPDAARFASMLGYLAPTESAS